MLDHLNELLHNSPNPLDGLRLVTPERNEQAGLTLPPTSIGRPVKPILLPPQPTNQAPTDKK